MSTFGSPSSDLPKGKKFLEKLLHVRHVDKENYTVRKISEKILRHLLAGRKVCHDSNSTENVGNPESNLDILKSFLKDRIARVAVFSNPLPIPLGSSSRVTFHAFVAFATHNTTYSQKAYTYWSLEKNGKYIILQQSTNPLDVYWKIYDAEKNRSVERYGKVKFKIWNMGNFKPLGDLLQIIWETNQISDPYHLLYSNCQNFASFIFKNLNGENGKWSTYLSAAVDRFRGRKKKTAIEVNAIMYQSMVKDDKFDYCKAMMEGKRKDFQELINDMTIEFLNSVDFQGYTLLEWATVFSASDWPIDKGLKKSGAKIPSDKEGLNIFRRNVFFIALQYLPPNKKSKFLSFDGVDIHGVNKTGDTSLHLALYGEKWQIAEDVLCKFEDDEVNSTNSLGETVLHLAAKLKCEIGLFKKIVNRTSSANINKADGNGWTALHYAIDQKSEIKVRKLLNHKKLDVNIQNDEDYCTALHLASKWPNIPADLFEIFLKNSTDINAQDVNGNTALHIAFFRSGQKVIKLLLKDERVDVKVRNNENRTALYYSLKWKWPKKWNWQNPKISADLAERIRIESLDINAQDEVKVKSKNKKGRTALHLVCRLSRDDDSKNNLITDNLIKIIVKQSTDVNAQDKKGDTALHIALRNLNNVAVKELLKRKDLDVNVKNNKNETAFHQSNVRFCCIFFASLFLPKTYYTRSWRNPSRFRNLNH